MFDVAALGARFADAWTALREDSGGRESRAPRTGAQHARAQSASHAHSVARTLRRRLWMPGRSPQPSTDRALASGPYWLFVPPRPQLRPPLVVMLHGCAQSARDFALATRMNERAAERGCLVLYPEQTRAANRSRCWNWFDARDQQRDAGEPAIVADLVATIVAEHGVDPRRVYVAGLSAGAAAAAVLGETYPDLFAAIGGAFGSGVRRRPRRRLRASGDASWRRRSAAPSRRRSRRPAADDRLPWRRRSHG